MSQQPYQRRSFLSQLGGAAAAGALAAVADGAAAADTVEPAKLHVASNVFAWMTFFKRDKRDFMAELEAGMAAVAESGVDGFETFAAEEHLQKLAPLLAKHKLQMRSAYMNVTLHDDSAAKNIDNTLAVADKAKALGTKFMVINANPIKWGSPENKDDAMLRRQAAAFDKLGRQLREMDMVLSYHFHDAELRNAAREFHHMLCGTDPKNLTLCWDLHWTYRGSGNSTVAVDDILHLHGKRISELHLRQSSDGVWTEAFGEGDIDYAGAAKKLSAMGIKPLLVLEQAVEAKSPKTLDAVTAHRQGVAYVRKIF